MDSLKNNTEPHDVIIVDDGSRVPLQDYLPAQPNLTVLTMPSNQGITAALNHGLQYIFERGYEFMARLDADDTTMPDRLSLQRAFLDAHADVALLGSWVNVVTETGETLFRFNYPVEHKAIVKSSYYTCCFTHSALMVRTEMLRRVGGYDSCYILGEDYALERRIARHAKVANLPVYLVNFTSSPKGLSQSNRKTQDIAKMRIQWENRNFLKIDFYAGIFKTIIAILFPKLYKTTVSFLKKYVFTPKKDVYGVTIRG